MSQNGYPGSGYGQAGPQPGYGQAGRIVAPENVPPVPPGYPGQQPGSGYPGQQLGSGYPGQQPGSGYPGQQPGYGQAGPQPGYGQAGPQPGYGQAGRIFAPENVPPVPPGYPGQQPGSGYPGQQPGSGYPGQQPGHGQAGQHPNPPPGYPQPPNPQPGYAIPYVRWSMPAPPDFSPSTDAQADAQALHKAMRGAGVDVEVLINILAARSADQRLQIGFAYKTMFGKDLVHELANETGGNLETLIQRMMYDCAHLDAYSLRLAMRGNGVDEWVLIDVLLTKSNADIKKINEAYSEMFKRGLEKDVVSETSGQFKNLLVAACQANRDETTEVDVAKAKKEAQDLYAAIGAGEKTWEIDKLGVFSAILSRRSRAQLIATFDEYSKISQHDIASTIEREIAGDFRMGLGAIVKCVKDKPAYFAERLYSSMKGAATREGTLIYCVVARSEIDLEDIKNRFLDRYGMSLKGKIMGDCSGHFKQLLLAIVKD